MPVNFPPGSPNNLSVTPVPVQVFTPNPAPAATPACRIFNAGSSVVYVGGPNVSPVSGFPILPGNRPIDLQNVNVNVYMCSGASVVAATGTISAATAAGNNSWTVATLNPGGVGGFIRLGNGTGVEYLQIATQTGAGTPWTITTTTNSLYDHAASATVATVTALPVPVSVQAGA